MRFYQAAAAGVIAALMALAATPALAVPSFSQQTGLACTACHVGGFGPQLTPFGRTFKIGGYTQSGGTGAATNIPLSAFLLASYTNTDRNQSAPASEHYGSNGNIAMDQISVFLAGRASDHVGAFIQGTFNGISSQAFVDNADIRATTQTTVFGTDSTIGLSLNNAPGLADPYNSTYPFGYPYVASALSLTPNAGTILGGSLAGNSLGLEGYVWIDQHIYLDLGLYQTMAPGLLRLFGQGYGPGSTTGVAPYLRAAYERDWGDSNAHIGAALFYSRYNPVDAAPDGRSTDGSYGHDSYTDLFVDGGYQYLTERHSVTLDGRYTYEIQRLLGSGNPANPLVSSSLVDSHVEEMRQTLTYYFLNTYGATVSWNRIWGKRNDLLYNNGQPDSGSIKGSPDSNAFVLEADWVPFGHDKSFGAPFANLKVGAQYTIYTQFNGSGTNYDGFGRSAADNNTLYLFLWTIF